MARWSGQAQAFVRDDDSDRRTLHRVTAWRPAPEGQGRHVTAAEPQPRKARTQPDFVAPVVVGKKPTRKR
jgi:hypothetical protein